MLRAPDLVGLERLSNLQFNNLSTDPALPRPPSPDPQAEKRRWTDPTLREGNALPNQTEPAPAPGAFTDRAFPQAQGRSLSSGMSWYSWENLKGQKRPTSWYCAIVVMRQKVS